MAITPVSSIPLNPYPSTLPIPEPGTKASAFFSRFPDQLVIPEPANRDATALNLLAPVPAGVTPGGVPTQAFNQAGGVATPSPTPAVTPGVTGTEVAATYPTYTFEPLQAARAAATVPAATTTETTPRALTTPPTLTEAVTGTETVETTTAPTLETDALPGLLQTAYRAPLASSLFPLAGLRGEAPSGGPAPLHVERTYAVAAMGEQARRQGFNPNPPTPRPNPAEAVAAYRGQGPVAIPEALGPHPALDVRA